MSLRRIRKNRLPAVVAEHLAAAVRAGEFAAGEKLPPERVLAERFGVSRNVVREAANELRTRGLLVTRQGSGSVISNHFHKPVSDLLEDAVNGRADGEWRLLELRSALEIDVARLAAERATRQEIEGLECVLNTYDRAGEDLEACAALDVAFHRTLAQVAHNDLFGLVLASLDELLVKARRLALERSGIACASRSHREILEAVKSRRPGSAAKAMERHLSMTRENLARSRGAAKRGKEKSKS